MTIAISNDQPIALAALRHLIQDSRDLNKDFTATIIEKNDFSKITPPDILFITINHRSSLYQNLLRKTFERLKKECRIIIHFDELEFEKAWYYLHLGAAGMISQKATIKELVCCIRRVSENKPYVCQRTIQTILSRMGVRMPGYE